MAGSAMVMDQPFHVRSVSMPCRPQPLALKFDEDLHKLKTCVASSTSTATPQTICNGLNGLGDLYDSIDELLRLPRNQQVSSYTHQKKWVEEELDQSIKLLDLCTSIRDTLVGMKECNRDLGLAFRRNDAASERELQAYASSAKKAQKVVKNCFRSLKQIDNKCSKSMRPIHDIKDSDLSIVVTLLLEAREVTVSLLGTVLSFMSKSMAKPKDSRWSFVSKALQQRKVACEVELATVEVESLECLETGLDCLFRRLIQSRVSLLNITSP